MISSTLLLLLASTGGNSPDAHAPTTPGGLVWSSPTGMSPAVVALADRGGQVAAYHSTWLMQLLSSFDSSPPTQVWNRFVTA